MAAQAQAQARGLEVRLLRRLPVEPAGLRGRTAGRGRRGRDRAISWRPRAPWCKGPYDLSLVEGSITTPHDAERIHEVRRASKYLVTIGACATAGGIQALRNFKDVKEFISIVYARPEYIETLDTSTPIADHVLVDFELRGCPINKHQLLEVIWRVPATAASRTFRRTASASSASAAARSA